MRCNGQCHASTAHAIDYIADILESTSLEDTDHDNGAAEKLKVSNVEEEEAIAEKNVEEEEEEEEEEEGNTRTQEL